MMPVFPPLHSSAFFFDFDGTLVDLAATPEGVKLSPLVVPLLATLSRAADGALAIVTGRPIETIDAMLAPLVLPVAGLHGAERRDAAGRLSQLEIDPRVIESMRQALEHTVQAHPGMLLEAKRFALALHYRGAPAAAGAACAAAEAIVAQHADVFVLQPGKMVVEIKPRGVDKGGAIRAFLAEAPFAGRTPLFAGDDLTDEKGFTVVNALGGMSLKVGAGATVAASRIDTVSALLGWLRDALAAQR